MPVLYAGFLDVIQVVHSCRHPTVYFPFLDAGRMVHVEGPVGERLVAKMAAFFSQSTVDLLRPKCTAVFEHKLVYIELPALTAKKPDCYWSLLGRCFDCFKHIALVYADLPRLCLACSHSN